MESSFLRFKFLLANFQIFKCCCDIQGSHLIGYLLVSLIIYQSECLICYFLCTELTLFCTELTLFCTELPENCIYLSQSELSNFFMYINITVRARISHYLLFTNFLNYDWFRKIIRPYINIASWCLISFGKRNVLSLDFNVSKLWQDVISMGRWFVYGSRV